MKKKSFLSIFFAFLTMSGMCLMSSCSNDTEENDYLKNQMWFLPIRVNGDFLFEVSGARGIARWDHERFPIPQERYHNHPYIETSNGDRYYFATITFYNDGKGNYGEYNKCEEFDKEFVEGAEMEFSGKVYEISDEFLATDELFTEMVKTTNVYLLIAPDFTIKRVSE